MHYCGLFNITFLWKVFPLCIIQSCWDNLLNNVEALHHGKTFEVIYSSIF